MDHSLVILSSSILGLTAQAALSSVHEVPTVKVLAGYLTANLVFVGFLARVFVAGDSIRRAVPFNDLLLNIFFGNATFCFTIIITTAIRRLFFSPLCKFPGEKSAALTKLYEARLWYQGRNAYHTHELHKKYGDFVRTGPYDLSINNVEATLQIYRKSPDARRGPFYEIWKALGKNNVVTQRDDRVHQLWRRIWEQGFRGEALLEYVPRLEKHADKLIETLRANEGREIDAFRTMINMTFDTMADLSFGKDAGMQDGTGDRTYMNFLHNYLQETVAIACLRNLTDLLPYIPSALSREFNSKGREMMEDRLKMGKTRKDVFTHLLGEDVETGSVFSKAELQSNAQVLIVAGSDTTALTLTNILRELSLHPEIQERLYHNLREVFSSSEEIRKVSSSSCNYLQAVVDETIRLWPVTPSGIQVSTGSNGLTIAGEYVPPGTSVRVPHLSLMTDERYFPLGDQWIPERWTGERSELIKDRRAFIPFSQGPHVCIGKHLALNQMRLVIAKIVYNFCVELGESYDDGRFLRGVKDYFVAQPGSLPLKFVRRESTFVQA